MLFLFVTRVTPLLLLIYRESNTNLVKWSDGSMQLHVGTDVYEVNTLRTDQG
jgi:hypothetical protein